VPRAYGDLDFLSSTDYRWVIEQTDALLTKQFAAKKSAFTWIGMRMDWRVGKYA
jgi:hypothetical protein